MQILHMFGMGTKKIIAANHRAEGTVTDVKPCYWLKINQKPLRTTPLDGAAFPHIVHFTYQVDGTVYQGRRFVNWNQACPRRGGKLTVYFDQNRPASYAAVIS